MKFQKLLMTGCRDIVKKHQKYHQNGFFPISDPQDFFKNRALSLLYPYGALTSCKDSEKTNERFLRYLETGGRTDTHTDGQGRLLRTPSGKLGVQYNKVKT